MLPSNDATFLSFVCVQDARFSIQPMTGAITLVAPLDYESMLASAAYYRLLVRVTDSGNPALSGCVQWFSWAVAACDFNLLAPL